MNIALAAQISQFDSKTQIYLYAAIGTIALLALAVVILMGKKGRKGGDPLNLDTHFLDGLEGSGGLTKEEMKRVRQAMVRQALRDQEQKKSPTGGISTKDLTSLAAQGPEALNAFKQAPESEERQKTETTSFAQQQQQKLQAAKEESQTDPTESTAEPPPVPENPPQPQTTGAKSAATEKKSGGSIDLDTLLERGLIEPGEYDRLKQLAEESSD